MDVYIEKVKNLTNAQLNRIDELSSENTELQFLNEFVGIAYCGEYYYHAHYFDGKGILRKKLILPNFMVYAGRVCPYCGTHTILKDSKEVYSKSYGNIFCCPECKSYVGVHKETDEALGRLADSELRKWKIEAHKYFNPLYKDKIINKVHSVYIPKTSNRKKAYAWLASQMRIKVEACHIGYFGINHCKKVIEICKPIIEKYGVHN